MKHLKATIMKIKLYVISSLLLLSNLFFGIFAYSQDPSQYGTPFKGVPDSRDASIYQVNMRCFSSTGNFQGVINRLDNIKALGVNVLYLMPVMPVGTLNAFNSPYCIKDFKAVNPEFGTLTDLRNLIDSAHSKGMAVLMDWVANQTSWDHPWITAHKDWYQQDANGNIIKLDGYTDIAALDFKNTSMRAAMIDAMRYWIFAVNCDGFRCDYANHAPVDFWTETISNLRSITTHNLLLFAEGDRSVNYTAGFDFNFSWNFYGKIKSIYTGSSATIIAESNSFDYTGATGSQQVIRWLSNHDIYGSEGSPFKIFGGKNGTLAAFVVTAYMKSVPFIYNGMEVGNTVVLSFPFTDLDINWEEDLSVTPEMTNIITLRNLSTAIRRGALTTFSNADVCAFKKISATDSVYAFINLRNTSKTFTLPAAIASKTMVDAFTNEPENFGTTLPLAAYQYRIFTNSGIVLSTTSVAINKDSIAIDGTGSEQLTAKVEPIDATYKSVYWESGNPGLVTVSPAGMVTGVSPGNSFIVARTINKNITDTCFVTLTGVAVSGITLNSITDTIKAGDTKQLTFTISPNDATNKNVSWNSSDNAFVRVSATGLITGIAVGSADITVTTADGKKADTCKVTVEKGPVGFTVYFSKPSTMTNSIKIYYWNSIPAGILPTVNWPGLPMTSLGNGLYKYIFPNIISTNLIFNDGTNQTGNLFRDKDGFYKDDIWYDSIPVGIAVKKIIAPDKIFVYPNPAENGHITIDLNKIPGNAFLKMIDIQGRIVIEAKLSSYHNTINISAVNKGIYIMKISTSSGIFSQKMVIK
jgi:glycosidase